MSQDKETEAAAAGNSTKAGIEETPSISRRNFIASVAAAGAAGSAISTGAVRASAATGGNSDYDVIVIGGGMAGSSAAREASKAGLKTVLLEARNRLGGRTYFADFAGKKVELGGNYIYWLQPHVWAEVDRYKLPISDSPSAVNPDRWIYLKDGRAVEADIATFWPKVDQAMTDYCSMSREVFPRPYNPHYTDNWKDYAGLSIQDRIDQLDLEEDVALTLNAIWSIMSHAPCSEGGFLEMLRWWAALGSNSIDFNNAVSRYALKNGTISLINAMIEDGNVDVQLSTPVSRISQKGGTVKVETETGQTMTAKHVIVTTPLNTWGDIEYEPAISDVKLKVAEEKHVGNGNKLHIMTKEDIGNVFLTADDSFGPLQYGYTYTTGPEGTHMLSYGLDGRFDVNNLKTVSAMVQKFLPDVEIKATYGYQWLYDPFSKGTWCTLRPTSLPWCQSCNVRKAMCTSRRPTTPLCGGAGWMGPLKWARALRNQSVGSSFHEAPNSNGDSGSPAVGSDVVQPDASVHGFPGGSFSCDDALGAAILDQCKVCHSVTEGAAHSTGPNLYGVVGREAASMEGFAYSKVLRQSGFTWDPATLDEFLARPQEVLPYNRMAFGGVTDDADRAVVICALQALK